jgi:hypothetical protein
MNSLGLERAEEAISDRGDSLLGCQGQPEIEVGVGLLVFRDDLRLPGAAMTVDRSAQRLHVAAV